MKFRNKSDDAREILGQIVEVGGVIDADPAGLIDQCGPDGAWEPVKQKKTDPAEAEKNGA